MLGFWAGVATIATVFVYIAQAYLMRETMVHANRAYVHVGTWESHPDNIGKDDTVNIWRIAPRIENTGSTPTRNLAYSTTIFCTNAEFPIGYRFKSEAKEKRTLLGPKQYFLSADLIVKTTDLVASKSNRVWYYMYGWIEYDDVFYMTCRHRTEYCYRIFVYGDPSRKDCNFGFIFHSEYNNADGECKRQRKIREKIPEPAEMVRVFASVLPTGAPVPTFDDTHSTPPTS
jgi:hypothetical protein